MGNKNRFLMGVALLSLVTGGGGSVLTAKGASETAAASGLHLVARDATQTRSNYQIVPHRQGGRWYLYVGHIRGAARNPLTGRVEGNGTSVLDITDPARPRYLTHIPPFPAPWSDGTAEEKTGAQHVQLCDGAALPAGRAGRTYMLRNKGAIGQEVVDVTDPLAPGLVGDVVHTARPRDGVYRTHKNVWDCASGIAYTVGSVTGWTGQVLQIFDLSDPAKPRHVRDFGLPGTQPGGTTPLGDGFSIHEASLSAGRVYLAYGADRGGVIEILDAKKLLAGDPAERDPLAPTDRSLAYPVIGRIDLPAFWGAHTAMPFLDLPIPEYRGDAKGAKRDMLFVTSEGINAGCSKVRHAAFFLDMTDPRHPWPISTFQVPSAAAPKGSPAFCARPGTNFGPHSPQAIRVPAYDGKLLFLSYFNAGLRVVDMRDPFAPREAGYWVAAPTPTTRFVRPPNSLPQYQVPPPPPGAVPYPISNTVEVDPRGRYIYVADRSGNGVYVLELTGAVKAIAAGP